MFFKVCQRRNEFERGNAMEIFMPVLNGWWWWFWVDGVGVRLESARASEGHGKYSCLGLSIFRVGGERTDVRGLKQAYIIVDPIYTAVPQEIP